MTADTMFGEPATLDPDQTDETSTSVPDETPEITDGPTCETCGRVIVREPGKRGRMPKYHPECRPSANKAATPRKKAKKSASGPDYEGGVNGIFQLAAWALSMAGDKNEMLLADSMAIAQHGPNIAAAINDIAMEKPEIAAVLDRVLAVGPYGAILATVSPFMMQIASNHGVKVPGFQDAKSYVRQFVPGGNPETVAA